MSIGGYQQVFGVCRFGGEDAAEPAGGTPAFRCAIAKPINVSIEIAAPIGISGLRYRITIVCVRLGTTNPWYAMFVAISGAGSPSIVADQ